MPVLNPTEGTTIVNSESLNPSSRWWTDGWTAANEVERIEMIRSCVRHAFDIEIASGRKRGFIDAFVIPNRDWLRQVKPLLEKAYPDGDRHQNFHMLTSEMRWFSRTLLKDPGENAGTYNVAMSRLLYGSTAEKSSAIRLLDKKRSRISFGHSDMDADYRSALIDLMIILAWDHVTSSRLKSGKDRVLEAALRHEHIGRQWKMSGHADLDALMPLTRIPHKGDERGASSAVRKTVQQTPSWLAKVILYVLKSHDLSEWKNAYGNTSRGLSIAPREGNGSSVLIEDILVEWLPGGESLVGISKALGETPRQLLNTIAAGASHVSEPLALPVDVELSL
jgi:hypothetical protein